MQRSGQALRGRLKLSRIKPVVLVILVSGILTQLEPSLGVWCGALSLPLLAVASLFVTRWWATTPPQLAVIAGAFSTMPAVHHAWVFNVEGNAILAWSGLFALVPLLLVVAVALRAALVRQIRARRVVFAIIAGVSCFSYGMGAAYFANTYFDRGSTQPFEAIVKSRIVSSYFGFLFKQYDLNVSPWGNHKSVDSINVSSDVIAALRVGDHVRIEQSPGLLGIPWVRVAAP